MWKHPAETLEALPQMRRGEMRQEILTGALKPMHREAGLKLGQPHGNLIALMNMHGREIAYFCTNVTIQDIRKAADNYMMETDMISYVGGNNG